MISVFGLTVFGQKDWQKRIEQIKPLVTTETEVVKTLGKPANRYGDAGEYQFEDGVLAVIYSEGRCQLQRMLKYNVDKGVVVAMFFSPRKKIKFASLGINIAELEKVRTEKSVDTDAIYTTYYDVRNGIYYTVNKKLLEGVEVHPLGDLNNLQCPKSSD